MTISGFKAALQKSLKIFLLSMMFITVVTFFSLYYKVDSWIIGFSPSIMIFDLIGAFSVTKAIVYLSSVEGELEASDDSEINEKFRGIESVAWMFYIVVPMVYIAVYFITGIYDFNILCMNFFNPIISFILFIIIIVAIYLSIDQLSFCLFFISIIYGWTKSMKVQRINEKLSDLHIVEDYDVETNIKKLIKRYGDRIKWLENHINEDNIKDYKSKIEGYQNIINDLSDILYGIDI